MAENNTNQYDLIGKIAVGINTIRFSMLQIMLKNYTVFSASKKLSYLVGWKKDAEEEQTEATYETIKISFQMTAAAEAGEAHISIQLADVCICGSTAGKLNFPSMLCDSLKQRQSQYSHALWILKISYFLAFSCTQTPISMRQVLYANVSAGQGWGFTHPPQLLEFWKACPKAIIVGLLSSRLIVLFKELKPPSDSMPSPFMGLGHIPWSCIGGMWP